jgi:methionyl-tRNA formyltransferase
VQQPFTSENHVKIIRMMLNVVFMGSPEFATPILKRLVENYHVAGVITQPDRPAGRGKILTPPPVKVTAQALGIEVIQPNRLREPEPQAKLVEWKPDLIIVAAFGQILRQNVLDLPRLGCVNVHASYLPRWRGAAPIQAAILHGDQETGVSIMKMDAGIDTGPVLAQKKMIIKPEDTSETLSLKLSDLGAGLLIEVLPEFISGRIHPLVQDGQLATYASLIKKEDGLLDFTQPAVTLANKIRAFSPWPGTFTVWQDQMLKIHRAHYVDGKNVQPGKKDTVAGMPVIGTGNGWLVLDVVQPAGKKALPGSEFLRGARGWE